MAGSPRPGVWALEKSVDGGKNWTAWQYFAGNDAGKHFLFGKLMAIFLSIIRKEIDCSTTFSVKK